MENEITAETLHSYCKCLEDALSIIRDGVTELGDSTFITDRGRKITKRILDATTHANIVEKLKEKKSDQLRITEVQRPHTEDIT